MNSFLQIHSMNEKITATRQECMKFSQEENFRTQVDDIRCIYSRFLSYRKDEIERLRRDLGQMQRTAAVSQSVSIPPIERPFAVSPATKSYAAPPVEKPYAVPPVEKPYAVPPIEKSVARQNIDYVCIKVSVLKQIFNLNFLSIAKFERRI